ncbi:MAG: hypothetical protein Fur0037_26010 [Planctomycetota bacterium]
MKQGRAAQKFTRREVVFGSASALLLLAGLLVFCGGRSPRYWPRRQILDAILSVESGGRPEPPDGDDGKAIGPYQIHEGYWIDARRQDPSLENDYALCRQRDYAERVVRAYMLRYAKDAWESGDAEVIARVHNGGPDGFGKPSTLPYWRKVERALRSRSPGSPTPIRTR